MPSVWAFRFISSANSCSSPARASAITTARDQALLGRAIQERFPRYYRYFAMPSFTYRGQTMPNHNHLLGQVEGLDGIKTGYTKASGFNLVTSVRRNNRHIVAVVLGGVSADARDTRMRSLIEEYIGAAAPRKSTTTTAEARQQPVEMRVTENRIREGHLAEPSAKGTRAADARPTNQPTEPAIYSVASYERPVRLLSSATPPSTTRATTAAPPFAAPLTDAKSDETTAGKRRASVTTKDHSNSFGMWLPSAEAASQHNVQLLVRPLFDIPVVYGDGKQSIIAVAKDATGVRAFAQALAGWDGSAAAAAPAISRFTDAFAVWKDYEAVSAANAAAPRTTESGSPIEQPSSNTVVDATPANDAYGNVTLVVVLLVVIVGVCFYVLPTIVASGRNHDNTGQYSRSTFCSVGASSAGCQRPTAEIVSGNTDLAALVRSADDDPR